MDTTDAAVAVVDDILTAVLFQADPVERVTQLAAAQHYLAWALRLALGDAHRSGHSWRGLDPVVGMPYNVLYRQVVSGGGVVAPEVSYRPPEVVVGLRTRGGEDDAWRVITAKQVIDEQLANTTIVYNEQTVELRHRPALEEERIGRTPLHPLWRPTMGRKLLLLTEAAAAALEEL
jgi:hypothetical protein